MLVRVELERVYHTQLGASEERWAYVEWDYGRADYCCAEAYARCQRARELLIAREQRLGRVAAPGGPDGSAGDSEVDWVTESEVD
jgi:hypothetical protein